MNARPRFFFGFLVLFFSGLQLFAASAANSPKKTDGIAAASPAALLGDAAGKGDSILQADDILRVQVFQEEDINKQGDAVRVSKDFTVTLPLVGEVPLKGKTARQAEVIIRDLYDKDFLVNPQVNVAIVKFAERFVNVTGAVNAAQRIALPPSGLTIIDAIALAGGSSRIADLKHVKLTRRKEDDDSTQTIEVNVDAMMKSGGRDAVQPLQLEKDDSIFVPERIL